MPHAVFWLFYGWYANPPVETAAECLELNRFIPDARHELFQSQPHSCLGVQSRVKRG